MMIIQVLSRILKIGVKMLPTRKSREFYYTFPLILGKKLESGTKRWGKIL